MHHLPMTTICFNTYASFVKCTQWGWLLSVAETCRSNNPVYFNLCSLLIINVCIACLLLPMEQQPLLGQARLIFEASRSHTDTPHSVGLLWMSDQPDARCILTFFLNWDLSPKHNYNCIQVPLMYCIPLAWIWPFEIETLCHIKEIISANCVNGNLFLLL
jgi:hypothetical protein